MKNNNKEKSYILVRIVCVILALSLWIVVMFDRNPKIEKTFSDVSVTVLNESKLNTDGYELMDDIFAYKIDVDVIGYSSGLASLSKKDIKATVNLSGYTDSSDSIPVNIELPDGIELVASDPAEVSCDIEKIISVDMKVSHAFTGQQKNGYYIYGSSTDVEVVKIEGASSLVNSVAKASVNIDINGADEDFTSSVPVRLYNASNEEILGLNITPTIVDQNVVVYKTKTVPIIYEKLGEMDEEHILLGMTAELENIKIAAPSKTIDSIDSVSLEPIDITGIIETTTFDQNIVVDDSFVVLTNAEKISVTAKVDKIISKDYNISPIKIDVRNLDENLTCNIPDTLDMINVKITAPSTYLDKITSDDIILYIDANGYENGEHDTEIQFEAIDGIEDIKIINSEISITID